MIKKIFALASVVLFTLTGCGTQTENINTSVNPQTISTFSNNSPVNSQSEVFIGKVAKMGVKLTSEQLKIISTQRHLTATGKFASRPAEKLTAEQNLQVHFNKHKKEFPNVKTMSDYIDSAVSFHKRNNENTNYYFDSTSFAKGYQSNVVKYDSKTNELSALRTDGDITTYYTSDQPSTKRFILVPEEFTY